MVSSSVLCPFFFTVEDEGAVFEQILPSERIGSGRGRRNKGGNPYAVPVCLAEQQEFAGGHGFGVDGGVAVRIVDGISPYLTGGADRVFPGVCPEYCIE